MSLLGFLTGTASLFGGSSSDKTNSNSNVKQQTKSTESQRQASTGTSTTTQSGTSTTTGSTAGTATGTEQQSTSQYSADVLASLDSLLSQSLASGGIQETSDALSGRLQQIQEQAAAPAFDVNQYVSGIANAATAATQSDLDSRINSILSATGSSEKGNSMSALLGNKLRNEAASNLAGIVSNAQATGQQIAQSQQESLTGQISQLSGDVTSQLTNLLSVAKGAQATSTGTSQQQTQESTTQKTDQSAKSTTQEAAVATTKGSSSQTTSQKGSSSSGKDNDIFSSVLKAIGNASKAA